MEKNRRDFLKAVSLSALGLCGMPALAKGAASSIAAKKPNILFIFPDQWRAQAFGYRGDPNVRTPNIEQLSKEGTEFTRAYSNHPICSPARSMLMTGLYTHQNGFLGNNFYLEQSRENLGNQLKAAGYATGYIGKWHLDGPERPGFVPPDRRQGWDDFHGFNRGHWYRLDEPDEAKARYFTPQGDLVFSEVYEPILQTDLAMNFLDRQDIDSPWALMVSYGPPHDPYTPPPAYQRLQPKDLQWRENVPQELRGDPQCNKDLCGYYGLCELMDEQIGRLLRHLEKTGQAENTYVVFASDHGDMQGSHHRHDKLLPFEESAAIPMIIRGPGIPVNRKEAGLVSIVDLPPTLISLAGGTPPPRMAGRDLTSTIRGAALADQPVLLEGFMKMEDRQWRALVTDRYKLILVAQEHPGDSTYDLVNALYDLKEDPYETKNLYHDAAHQGLVKELTAQRASLAGRTGDPFPKMTKAAPEKPPV